MTELQLKSSQKIYRLWKKCSPQKGLHLYLPNVVEVLLPPGLQSETKPRIGSEACYDEFIIPWKQSDHL